MTTLRVSYQPGRVKRASKNSAREIEIRLFWRPCIYTYYYIDISVLPKNRQLVFSIRNYTRDTSKIFFISSLVKISLAFFLCFSFSFFFIFETVISIMIVKISLTPFLCFSSSFFIFETFISM